MVHVSWDGVYCLLSAVMTPREQNYVSLSSFADIYYLCQKTQILEKVIPLLHRDCQKILES